MVFCTYIDGRTIYYMMNSEISFQNSLEHSNRFNINLINIHTLWMNSVIADVVVLRTTFPNYSLKFALNRLLFCVFL